MYVTPKYFEQYKISKQYKKLLNKWKQSTDFNILIQLPTACKIFPGTDGDIARVYDKKQP